MYYVIGQRCPNRRLLVQHKSSLSEIRAGQNQYLYMSSEIAIKPLHSSYLAVRCIVWLGPLHYCEVTPMEAGLMEQEQHYLCSAVLP